MGNPSINDVDSSDEDGIEDGKVHGVPLKKSSGVPSLIFNLSASAMGAGVLTLPQALYFSGAAAGSVTLVIFAFCSALSMVFLARSARLLRAHSYEEVGEKTYGCAGVTAVRVALVVLLLGANISYFIVIGDLSTPLVCRLALNGTYNGTSDVCEGATASAAALVAGSKPVCIIVLALVPFALSLLHSLKPLQFSSMGAVGAVVVVSIFIVVRAVQGGVEHTAEPGMELLPSRFLAFTLAFPLQSVAFCSQFNVIELQNEAMEGSGAAQHAVGSITGPLALFRARALMRWTPVDCGICASVALVCTLYTMVGFSGYFLFGSQTALYGNILNAFPPSDVLIDAGSVLIVLTVLLKLPLVLLPMRQVLNSSLCGERKLSPALHFLECLGLTAVCVALAIVLNNLALAFQFLGCIGGTVVCFVMPGVFYFKTMKIVPTLPSSPAEKPAKRHGRRRVTTVDNGRGSRASTADSARELASATGEHHDLYARLDGGEGGADDDADFAGGGGGLWSREATVGLALAIFGAVCGVVSLVATIVEMVDPAAVAPPVVPPAPGNGTAFAGAAAAAAAAAAREVAAGFGFLRR